MAAAATKEGTQASGQPEEAGLPQMNPEHFASQIFWLAITFGLLFIIEQLIPTLWGHQARNLGDPWGVETIDAAGLSLAVRDLWTLGLAGAALAGFFAFDRYTRYGLAMRATALDQEAALAQARLLLQISAASCSPHPSCG